MSWEWLEQITGGSKDEPPVYTQADLQRALREKQGEPAPVFTGEALYGLFFQVFFSDELTLKYDELHHDSRTGYDQVAQAIHERYILSAAHVSPKVVEAQVDVMHAFRELLKEWYWESLDPKYVHPWEEQFCRLREKTLKLLGEDYLSKL